MAETNTISEAQGSSTFTEFNVRRDHGTPHFIRLYDSVVERLERSAAIEKGDAFGILLGTVDSNAASCTVVVEGCEPSEVVEDHVLGWTAPAGSRRIVVGYYRSHASSRFAIEDADRYLFERCFPKDVRVALLVKAPKGGAGAGQIYLGEDGQVEADRVTVEFPFSLKQLVAEPPAAPLPTPVAVKRSRSERFWKMGLTAAAAAASVIGLKGVGLFDRQAAAPVAPLVRPVEQAPAPPEPAPKPRPAAPAVKKPPVETRRVASVSPTPVRQLVAEAPPIPVQEYSAPPRAIRQVAPVVREALRQSITGEIVVRVRVEVDSNGRVISAEPLTQGRPLVDALAVAAVAAVKRWEFEPARPGQTILNFAFRR